MVIGAGAEPRLMVPFTADKRAAARAGADVVGHRRVQGKLRKRFCSLTAFLKRGSADHVMVISDGAFAGAEEFAAAAPHLRFVKVTGGGENVGNVGIVGFEVRRQPERGAPAEILVHVRNYTAKAVRVPLALSLGDGKSCAPRSTSAPTTGAC